MLKHLQSHHEYLTIQNRLRSAVPREALEEYHEDIQMFRHLNFDRSFDLLRARYSHTGRPALVQIEILRCMVLCAYFTISWEKILHFLHHRAVFRLLAGISKEEIPTLPSFYELCHRLMPTGENAMLREKRRKKPSKKYKKNEKMPEARKGRTTKMAKIIRKGNFNLARPERYLQELFKLVSIDTSVECGILHPACYVSGDGTCVPTGACNYGRKVCSCHSCDCAKRYSDPMATYGWDSSKEQYFYGHTAYLLSTYNTELRLDLPLFLRTLGAHRHDSVSALISLTEFRQVYPEFTMKGFLSDSASDNYETYHLLREWRVPAFIALNKQSEGHFTYKQVEINSEGTPIVKADCP